jgi:hypothetical protein
VGTVHTNRQEDPLLKTKTPSSILPATVPPVRADSRMKQVRARAEVLEQRLATVEAAANQPVRDDVDGLVAQLMRDPSTPVVAPPPTPDPAAEIRALRLAIEATAAERQRIHDEVSTERAHELRPAKVAHAKEMVDAAQRLAELIEQDLNFCRELTQADYNWSALLPQIGFAPDRDVLLRVVQRIRESRLLD